MKFPYACKNVCTWERNQNTSATRTKNTDSLGNASITASVNQTEILHFSKFCIYVVKKNLLKQQYNAYTQFIFGLEFWGFFLFCSSGKQSTCISKDVSFPINFSGHTAHVLKNVKTLTTGIEFSATMSRWLWGCNTPQTWHVKRKGQGHEKRKSRLM